MRTRSRGLLASSCVARRKPSTGATFSTSSTVVSVSSEVVGVVAIPRRAHTPRKSSCPDVTFRSPPAGISSVRPNDPRTLPGFTVGMLPMKSPAMPVMTSEIALPIFCGSSFNSPEFVTLGFATLILSNFGVIPSGPTSRFIGTSKSNCAERIRTNLSLDQA